MAGTTQRKTHGYCFPRSRGQKFLPIPGSGRTGRILALGRTQPWTPRAHRGLRRVAGAANRMLNHRMPRLSKWQEDQGALEMLLRERKTTAGLSCCGNEGAAEANSAVGGAQSHRAFAQHEVTRPFTC